MANGSYRPRNTSADPAEVKLLIGLDPGGIYAQEAQGQAEVLNSTTLPTDTRGKDADFEALGFTFGAQVPGDPLFREATLPAGWSRKGTDHSMHSVIEDERGIARVNIFYKAAYYDRRADMSLMNVAYRFVTDWVYGDERPELNPLFTEDELHEILKSVDGWRRQITEMPSIYEKYAPAINELEVVVYRRLYPDTIPARKSGE